MAAGKYVNASYTGTSSSKGESVCDVKWERDHGGLPGTAMDSILYIAETIMRRSK